ncbi:MAG TPA: hypothetical protein VK002_10795 [Rubricoccaceae bacterium]|nr:hypothetical protein [Rubricoccaceae bacterium]
MRLLRLLFYAVLIAASVAVLHAFLTGGLPGREAEGVLAPSPPTQPDTAPAQSMEGGVLEQEEVVRDFMESVPSPVGP